MLSCDPDYMYLTHYGRVDDVRQLAVKLIEGIDAFATFGERFRDDESRRQKIGAAMTDWLLERLHEHGGKLTDAKSLELLCDDIALNTSGIECWLDYRDR